MTNGYLLGLAIAAGAILCLQILLLRKRTVVDFSALQQRFDGLATSGERMERALRDEIARNREESTLAARDTRQELSAGLAAVSETFHGRMVALTQSNGQFLEGLRNSLEQRFGTLTEANNRKLDLLREAVEAKLRLIQEDNARQLDRMRETVDEKLQGTLEKRLGECFRLVSDRLEQVYKGLGEMQNLATGVGDLKKVLTNVKTRGTWGEVQLGAMLEQVLSPDQYSSNVATKDDNERVEYAIKLPGRNENQEESVWLPIDAKFPAEDYQRLLEAQEKADPDAAEQAAKQLETRIKHCARDICSKYILPPRTTDFAILFLPTEGLFAEVIRRVGLPEYVQRECRVVIAGPTTLWSILNSLQMGFRTLAIQKRSGEVWHVLGAVKAEFGKFGTLLEGVKKKLDSASSSIEDAARKSRTIERRLRGVQELPESEVRSVLQCEMRELDLDGLDAGK